MVALPSDEEARPSPRAFPSLFGFFCHVGLDVSFLDMRAASRFDRDGPARSGARSPPAAAADQPWVLFMASSAAVFIDCPADCATPWAVVCMMEPSSFACSWMVVICDFA